MAEHLDSAGRRHRQSVLIAIGAGLVVLGVLIFVHDVLDGGHLAFLAMGGAQRRPLTLRQRQAATQLGAVVLVGIMVLALSNDLMRLFR